jgi:P-type Cu+ transporter
VPLAEWIATTTESTATMSPEGAADSASALPGAMQPTDHLSKRGNDPEPAHAVEPIELARIVSVAVIALAVWLRIWEPFNHVSVLGVAGAIVGGWPIFEEAWENLRERRMTMELSMTIALVAALAIGEFFTALVITLFVLIAEVLEGLTVGRGRRAIRDLLDCLPATAVVRREVGPVRVALSEITPGDVVLIAPGERIATDGIVLSGHSHVDQAPITGESTAVEKLPGSDVYAGTINQSGVLEVQAQRIGRDTSFGKIIEAVERAERSRAPVQKTADRYAGYLVYFALGCAALTFALTRDARSTISVIIVAGACGIAAGTPLAVLGAIGRAARAGAIIKGGRYLEVLWRVDTVAFDKTGTLTLGTPDVREIRPLPGITEAAVLEAAAIAERRSEHPFAAAIVRRAEALGLSRAEPETFAYSPGRGIAVRAGNQDILVGNRAFITDRGHTPVAQSADLTTAATEIWVARGGVSLGSILIADVVRAEAAAAVSALKSMGLKTVLVTGDVTSVAEAIGRDVHIDDVRAELLPAQKVETVRQLAAGGRTIAMVGDGVNDAPALMQADVGIAMGSGTDVARESADVVLLGNDLSKLVETLTIARRAHDIIRFNFTGTLVVDAIGVGLAAAGLLNPLLAAFIHVASELAFIMNSARLLPARSRPGLAVNG